MTACNRRDEVNRLQAFAKRRSHEEAAASSTSSEPLLDRPQHCHHYCRVCKPNSAA